MNKSEFIKAISEKSEATIKDTEKFVNSFIDVVTETMVKGEDVTLVGFGTFLVAEHGARIGRDFKTGKSIEIPASKSVKFKPGKTLKDSVK